MLLQSQLAVETFKASGVRTVERLNALCEHYANVYGMASMLEEIQKEAKRNIPAWMFE